MWYFLLDFFQHMAIHTINVKAIIKDHQSSGYRYSKNNFHFGIFRFWLNGTFPFMHTEVAITKESAMHWNKSIFNKPKIIWPFNCLGISIVCRIHCTSWKQNTTKIADEYQNEISDCMSFSEGLRRSCTGIVVLYISAP